MNVTIKESKRLYKYKAKSIIWEGEEVEISNGE